MEDSKRDIHNSIVSFFQVPWVKALLAQVPYVKALLAFIIFVAIFWAGANFGSRYGRPEGPNGFMMGFQKGGDFRSGQMVGGNNQGQIPTYGVGNNQNQQPNPNKGTNGGANMIIPPSQQSGTPQGQQTQQPVAPTTSAQ